jgi:hypothetical protein
MMLGSDSADDAAMNLFPARHCRVVAARVEGDDAFVLLDTGSTGQPYLYGVNCRRQDGRWFEMSSGNGPGWALSDEERRLGTWSAWDEAPAHADLVRIEFNGQVVEERVVEGAYLAVWWRQPEPDGAEPRAIAFRIKGDWVPQPDR